MDLGDLREYINFVAVKENAGFNYSAEQFNTVLPVVEQELYNMEYGVYEDKQVITDALSPYKVIMGGTALPLQVSTGGIATIPTDYMHYSSMWYKSIVGSVGLIPTIKSKPIERLTDAEWGERLSSYIIDENEYPFCTMRDTYFEFRPKTVGFVEFTYLKQIVEPIYDYYISVNDEEIFLTEGATHVWATGEVDSSGTTHTLGDPDYTSTTVESGFEDNTFLIRARLLLTKAGIHIGEDKLAAYSEQQQQKAGNQ